MIEVTGFDVTEVCGASTIGLCSGLGSGFEGAILYVLWVVCSISAVNLNQDGACF